MESSNSADDVIEILRGRGWCIGDLEQAKVLITISSALVDDGNAFKIADSVERELLNMDLRSIGGRSLPDTTQLRRSSHLSGPKVLQITSVRDICRSSIDDSSGNSSSRLLRLSLTDGHSEITAIEYSHIASIPTDVVPGTKVRLENKTAIHNCILCLKPEVLTVLGGVVQSLYEEWQMKKKYSGLSRSSLRRSEEGDTGGPPPFEKLQTGPPSHRFGQQGKFSYCCESFKGSVPIGNPESGQARGQQTINSRADQLNSDIKTYPVGEKTEEQPCKSDTRPKEVAEYVPLQNQAAAQKLLQKMNQLSQDGQHSRGRKYRGKGKQEEPVVFTLDEWERRKAGAKPLMKNQLPDTSHDEDLAWKLQNQLDLEESHVQRTHDKEAEKIRMSMFSYDKRDDDVAPGAEQQGRGSGRAGGHPTAIGMKQTRTPKAIIYEKFGSKACYKVEEVQDLTQNGCPGLAVPQKGPCLYRCILELPDLYVVSETFKKKKDAEQSAAEMALLKEAIDYHSNGNTKSFGARHQAFNK